MSDKHAFTLVSPLIAFSNHPNHWNRPGFATAGKLKLHPEDWMPFGWKPLFNAQRTSVSICQTTFWQQAPKEAIPVGCEGDATLGISLEGQYSAEAHYPEYEDAMPRGPMMNSLGAIIFNPGHRGRMVAWPHPYPKLYRLGDDVIFAAQFGAYQAHCDFQIMVGLDVISDTPFEMEDDIGELMPLTQLVQDGGGFCSRRTETRPLRLGGTRLQVHVAPGSVLSGMSVGLQASGPTMAATPVPVTFGGNAGVSAGAGGAWSDIVNLSTTKGARLLVDGQTNGPLTRKELGPTRSWGVYGVDTHATAGMAGSIIDAPRWWYHFDAIRILP